MKHRHMWLLALTLVAGNDAWAGEANPPADIQRPSTMPAASNGAAPDLWAVRPVVIQTLPDVRGSDWVQSPVDRFILARLEASGLDPMPAADRRTLIRRATFDLTGLPPTPEEVEDFLADTEPHAFERVVDRLLASPRYGERWGRHWLDVVRYADTSGCNSDYPIPEAYKYRDYVIQSFNDDLPYDQFLREQIAGDLLPTADAAQRRRGIIATGYLAISRRFGSSDPEFHLTIEDTIDNVGKAVLGLSVSCARCHDHKFDPISTRDYYALYGIFQSTRYAFPGMEDFPNRHDFVPLNDADRAAGFAYQAAIAELDQRIFALKSEVKALKRTAEAKTPSGTGAEVQSTDGHQRTADEAQKELDAAKKQQDKLLKSAPEMEMAYAVSEGTPSNAKLQIKGNPEQLGEDVPRAFLTVLGGQALDHPTSGSGRLELAHWLTDARNPLTARVMVNRVWQYHFGRGIVATPNDFGVRGTAPTHPELLDWLAGQFIERGWSVKSLHKLVMLSSAYQLISDDQANNARLDPGNRLLWKFNRQRLDAEEIRDAMKAVSGTLDLTMGGAHPFPSSGKMKYTQHKPFSAVYESNQRSVYLMRQRRQTHPYLDLFDAADPKATTAVRSVSTTALQALFTMNSAFVEEQASHLGGKLFERVEDDDARIERVHRLIFARSPTRSEVAEAREYLNQCRTALSAAGVADANLIQAAWTSYCRVLLSSNEFVFVD